MTAEGLALAAAIREAFAFRGAESFVAWYGFDLVEELVRMAHEDVAKGGVENPAAFLRWLAVEEAGR